MTRAKHPCAINNNKDERQPIQKLLRDCTKRGFPKTSQVEHDEIVPQVTQTSTELTLKIAALGGVLSPEPCQAEPNERVPQVMQTSTNTL